MKKDKKDYPFMFKKVRGELRLLLKIQMKTLLMQHYIHRDMLKHCKCIW